MYADQPAHHQHYYACITAMDEQVGRLRAELDRLGVSDNTMVWYCSDNGPARQGSPRHVGSNGGLSGHKLSLQEGGIRVPGLLVWPARIDKPRTVSAPCVTSDYFPTILDALDIPLPADREYDGVSLLPLIDGERKKRDASIGFLNREGAETVWMSDRYKLFSTGRGDRLYDIVDDPAERENLADNLPEVVARMKAEMAEWRESVYRDKAEIE